MSDATAPVADPSPFVLGAAWYPELWDHDTQRRDVELMLEAGLNTARLGEFAWGYMEPRRGEYRWDWLHEAMDLLKEGGLNAVLCTPTATPPAWLTHEEPEVLQHLWDRATPMTHGGRRHYSPHSPVYREHCRRITDAMGREFGSESRHDHVIAWQIDNEVSGAGEYDVSPVAREAFHGWLRERFEDIEGVNDALNAGGVESAVQRVRAGAHAGEGWAAQSVVAVLVLPVHSGGVGGFHPGGGGRAASACGGRGGCARDDEYDSVQWDGSVSVGGAFGFPVD